MLRWMALCALRSAQSKKNQNGGVSYAAFSLGDSLSGDGIASFGSSSGDGTFFFDFSLADGFFSFGSSSGDGSFFFGFSLADGFFSFGSSSGDGFFSFGSSSGDGIASFSSSSTAETGTLSRYLIPSFSSFPLTVT